MQNNLLEEFQSLGLNFNTILSHQKIISKALKTNGIGPKFKIIEPCTVGNGRIFSQKAFNWAQAEGAKSEKKFAALVPAAGAASRYIKPLYPLINALTSDDLALVKKELNEIKKYMKVLPCELKEAFQDPSLLERISRDERLSLAKTLYQAKALFPLGESKDTFLQLKQIEHENLKQVEQQIFITPFACAEKFRTNLNKIKTKTKLKTIFVEQGPKLSTLRFNEKGEPARDNLGRLSPVPSGHGALLSLFTELASPEPKVESFFIRNIDNAVGAAAKVLEASEAFLNTHNAVLERVQKIRTCLNNNLISEANTLCHDFLQHIELRRPSKQEESFFNQQKKSGCDGLWIFLCCLFQRPLPDFKNTELAEKTSDLKRYFMQPVNTLGQVRRSESDTGGSPVVIETDKGPLSICLERAHVNKEDQSEFLNNLELSTHFNPVFVAAEIPDSRYYDEIENHFWLLSKKNWRGKDVYYYETAMYEVLGNCRLTNCLFLDVPRFVFNPHKSLDDALKSHGTLEL